MLGILKYLSYLCFLNSSKMEVQGNVHKVFATDQVNDSFKKRVIVLDTGNQYNPHLAIEFHQEAVDKLNGINPGDRVSIKFDLYSNESNSGRWFNNVKGWAIENVAVPA